MAAFADTDELYAAVNMFTRQDVLAKQEIIAKYGEIGDWDVQNVTNMRHLFHNCYAFNSDLSKWNVANVQDTNAMFYKCLNFNSDLSLWNVANVQNMTLMFLGCKNFNSDFSLWNVENVPDMIGMTGMFENCPKFLNSINGFRWKKQYWKILRSIFKTRVIALYWLEQSAITSCAPGGDGRIRDLEAFNQEWVY